MDLSPRAVLSRFRGKALRFVTVSIIGTVLTQILLVLMSWRWDWPGVVANILAVSISTIPSYLLNRYWVWGKWDPNRAYEIAAFWALTLAGLALSTLFVAIAEAVSDVEVLVNVGNMAGFGVLWIVKFLILDEVLFSPTRGAGDPAVRS